jgi:hypothetical protein
MREYQGLKGAKVKHFQGQMLGSHEKSLLKTAMSIIFVLIKLQSIFKHWNLLAYNKKTVKST